jgi:molecular chaperone DnaK (HSP70)
MALIGIDLGTTNTVAALTYDDGPHVIPRGEGRVIPSVVYYRWESGLDDVVVGQDAEKWEADGTALRSVKRLMGRTYDEALREGSGRYFSTNGGPVRLVRRGERDLGLEVRRRRREAVLWPHEVSAHVLRTARRHAESCLKRAVDGAAITVPAYFRDPHRQATLDAARQAGLQVVGELLDEPSAAAFAFARVLSFAPGEPVLVVDWGGGTLDVTVQHTDGRRWVQRAIGGDLVLGGDDVDLDLARYAVERARLPEETLDDPLARWQLRKTAQFVKELLSGRPEAAFVCPLLDPETGRPRQVALKVRREELEEHVLAPRLARVRAEVEACLARPDARREAIRRVLLVGGSSRIPAFRAVLAELLPRAALHDEVDPMHAVALGAALYARERPELARVCPYGYAVVDDDGRFHDAIPAGTEAPTPRESVFGVPARTRYAGQTIYRLTLAAFTQAGEDRRYHDRQRLFARGLPASAAGSEVDVTLWLDANKTIQAACQLSGRPGEFPMSGREEGPEELYTSLAGASLDGEALLEANARGGGGLLEGLRGAVEGARAVLDSSARGQGGRGEAETALARLRDLREQLAARTQAEWGEGLSDADKARARISDWLSFFEGSLLPKFWDALEPAARAEAIEGLRGVRVMLETRAPADVVHRRFYALREQLFAGPLGPALEAWYWGAMLGLPTRLHDALHETALRARDHHLAGDAAARDRELEALLGLRAEAEASYRAWKETGTVVEAAPDLVVGTARRTRGD